MTFPPPASSRRSALLVTALALVSRLAVVAWAASRIPAAADGKYYDLLARRLASGDGYTWLWPDGAVTYAAHYPVGYPALVALVYAAFGKAIVWAMLANALIGAAGAWAAYDVLARVTSPKLALAGGLAMALHPALVPYTAALMTEGVTTALLAIAVAIAARARDADAARRKVLLLAAAGILFGLATLVRPQSLLLAPLIGLTAIEPERASDLTRRLWVASFFVVLCLVVCAPWTARNCARMQKCALVSVNGGWNLEIGTQTLDGGWREIIVPPGCTEVFQEAAKDACFGDAAKDTIAADPVSWLARVPAKMHVTFDYFGAAPWYLHEANPRAFPWRAKVILGGLEVLVTRALLLAALVAVRKLRGRNAVGREAVTGVGLIACFVPSGGCVAYLACALAILLIGPRALARAPLLVPASAIVILATAFTHAVFFGAGRYGLVVLPFVTALAFLRDSRAADPDALE